MNVLVDAAELRTLLAAPERVVLVDVRWQLAGPPGRDEYLRGHVPGAVFVDLDTELAMPAPQPADGRHPLPTLGALQSSARRWGVNTGDTVVAYDDSANTAAARLWWLLRDAGVDTVRLLDGGLRAWTEAGGALESGDVRPEPGDIALTAGTGALALDDVLEFATHNVLLDARVAERYRGEIEPIDPVAGHIPGAVNAPTGDNLDESGRFLSAAALRTRFATLGITGARPVGAYCGSGVYAAHEIAALAIAGIDAVLYPGSWSQWSNHRELPVATGPDRGLLRAD